MIVFNISHTGSVQMQQSRNYNANCKQVCLVAFSYYRERDILSQNGVDGKPIKTSDDSVIAFIEKLRDCCQIET